MTMRMLAEHFKFRSANQRIALSLLEIISSRLDSNSAKEYIVYNIVDLDESFQMSIYYYLLLVVAKTGFDTAENQPFKVCQELAD